MGNMIVTKFIILSLSDVCQIILELPDVKRAFTRGATVTNLDIPT